MPGKLQVTGFPAAMAAPVCWWHPPLYSWLDAGHQTVAFISGMPVHTRAWGQLCQELPGATGAADSWYTKLSLKIRIGLYKMGENTVVNYCAYAQMHSMGKLEPKGIPTFHQHFMQTPCVCDDTFFQQLSCGTTTCRTTGRPSIQRWEQKSSPVRRIELKSTSRSPGNPCLHEDAHSGVGQILWDALAFLLGSCPGAGFTDANRRWSEHVTTWTPCSCRFDSPVMWSTWLFHTMCSVLDCQWYGWIHWPTGFPCCLILRHRDIRWPVVQDLRRSCSQIGVHHAEPLGPFGDLRWRMALMTRTSMTFAFQLNSCAGYILLLKCFEVLVVRMHFLHPKFWNCPPARMPFQSTLSIFTNSVTGACWDATYTCWNPAKVLVENISEWFSLFFLLYRCVLGQGGWAAGPIDVPPTSVSAPGFAVLNIINSVTWRLPKIIIFKHPWHQQ